MFSKMLQLRLHTFLSELVKDQDTKQMCHFWCTLTLQPPMNDCEIYLTDVMTLYHVQEPVKVSKLDSCLLPQNLDSAGGCQTSTR